MVRQRHPSGGPARRVAASIGLKCFQRAAAALLLVVSGYVAAILAGLSSMSVFLPLGAGLVLYLLDGLAGRVKGLLVVRLTLTGGVWLVHDLSGINFLFAVLLNAGGGWCCRSPASTAAMSEPVFTRCWRS